MRLPVTLAIVAAAGIPAVVPRLEAQFRVVNMTPREYGYESAPAPEPALSVNRIDATHIVATAVFFDEMAYGSPWPLTEPYCLLTSGYSLILQSFDAGVTWQNVCGVPVDPSKRFYSDPSLRFAGPSLFAAYLNPGVAGSDHPARAAWWDKTASAEGDPLAALARNPTDPFVNRDQPQVDAIDNPIAGRTAVFMANAPKKPASLLAQGAAAVDYTLDTFPASGLPQFVIEYIDRRPATVVPAVRIAMHPLGVGYAAFYRRDPSVPSATYPASYDVVVVRGYLSAVDNGFSRQLLWSGFGAIKESGTCDPTWSNNCCYGPDNRIGVRVERCTKVFAEETWTDYGFQDLSVSNLSIAVDPKDPMRVYVAYADGVSWANYTIRLRESTDGGVTWSSDKWTMTKAINPALAIDNAGRVGLLYQQLFEEGSDRRWRTMFTISANDFATTAKSYILADNRADLPKPYADPYVGDYVGLETVGGTFYGVFSASNEPRPANFPQGVTFARPAVWDDANPKLTDEAGNPVDVSIDPYFFSVTGSWASGCYSYLKMLPRALMPSFVHVVAKATLVAAEKVTMVLNKVFPSWLTWYSPCA